MTIKTYNSSQFTFDKNTKRMVGEASELGMRPGNFPQSLDVVSDHTGRTVRFVYDLAEALRNEFWDGEMVEYVPSAVDGKVNVERLVIFND